MKIKDLLSDKSKWAQGSWAYDKYGTICTEKSSYATSFCLLGAVRRCYSEDKAGTVITKLFSAIRAKSPRTNSILTWNDSRKRKFSEVKQLVNKLDV